jgi:diaminohydroxyphosphoribosylaminopyrimidine deaminase/5-amino-6-(5-phosphoribosylamino)uracil reductase
MTEDERYMQRCFQLARLGGSRVSPNPLVGAVLTYQGRILGEGYHHQYGTAHAEVRALQSVALTDKRYISQSTLYVSLEPCCIFGRTPPCTQLIIKERIPRVVVSCLDQTPEVRGQGIQLLRNAGVQVTEAVLEKEGLSVARFRNCLATNRRPYIILKYAVSADFKMGSPDEQVWLSNPFAKRWAHRLRHETAAILIGTRTASIDNPELNTRFGFSNQASRLIIDLTGKLPSNLRLFNNSSGAIVLSEHPEKHSAKNSGAQFVLVNRDRLLPDILTACLERGFNSLLVEGGAETLRHFIGQDLWDEAFIVHTQASLGPKGIPAPCLPHAPFDEVWIGDNRIAHYTNNGQMG